jgi:hypothetical protein
MTFWHDVLVGFVANVLAGFVFVGFYILFQWFLRATDLSIRYNWTQDAAGCRPNFNIRNRSGSRTYLLANIEYRKSGKTGPPLDIDNRSLWDVELKPGSIMPPRTVAPVKNTFSLADCTMVRPSVRLQNGRQFWLKGQGPGQMGMGSFQRLLFWLRDKIERHAFPIE